MRVHKVRAASLKWIKVTMSVRKVRKGMIKVRIKDLRSNMTSKSSWIKRKLAITITLIHNTMLMLTVSIIWAKLSKQIRKAIVWDTLLQDIHLNSFILTSTHLPTIILMDRIPSLLLFSLTFTLRYHFSQAIPPSPPPSSPKKSRKRDPDWKPN